jgi:cytochrome c-type biogenesis protein CcmH
MRHGGFWTMRIFLITILVLLVAVFNAAAQDVITDDEVNDVAAQLYCPVCENIPLEVCGTAACAQWREEIRGQLASGMTEDEVITDFVRRFGDRVVGTPQDPTLRALSLVTPWVLALIAVALAALTFLRWRGGAAQPATPAEAETHTTDFYRSQIEADLHERR